MRVVVFFDLPVLTKQDIRQYNKFRNHLLSQGFIMVQKSVYSKISLNGTMADTIIENLKRHKPESGVVQVLVITEKQYQGIEFLIGEGQKGTLDTQQRLVVF
ncbi:MAG: CRISPR-associated endonuclease Cas2 [Gudongella sp.]|nr:CRISPR-associated endonuclease Cas2 [Gudongella sp.]